MSLWTRSPAVAGRFYTDNSDALKAQLHEMCPLGEPSRRPYAVMAPHAGYRYSGKIAGEVYRRTEIPNEVFILCPNHTGRGVKISVWAEGEWETPLGSVPVASERAKKFLEKLPAARADREAHRSEHAIEVHLPFLLHRNPNVRVVPVVLGGLGWQECRAVGEALAACMKDSLLIASTDMSHYLPAAAAKTLDEKALQEVDAVNGAGLYETVTENDISMCGFIPTASVLAACRHAGVSKGERLAYGTSGDVTGDQDSVVAYAASWFFRP